MKFDTAKVVVNYLKTITQLQKKITSFIVYKIHHFENLTTL
jgi:hypothetical protein